MAKAAFDPDRNLVVDQFVKLNREFYSGRPHYYLRQRMYGIVLMCAQSSALAEALKDPVWLGEFGIQGPQLRLPEESADDYAAMDVVVLFHHAAEALLRLYFAHEDEPLCPWLEVSRVGASREFKKKVAAFVASLDGSDTEVKIMNTFRGPGAADPASHDGPVGEWMIGRDGLIYFLRQVATLLLDDAPLYNAAKHGLAVLSAPVGVRLGRLGEQPVITADGPSLAYLRQPHRREPDPMWSTRRGVCCMDR